MKRKRLLIGIVLIISITSLISVSIVMATNIYFEEPSRPDGLSSDIKWDTTRGEYALEEDLDEYGRVKSLSSQTDAKADEATFNPQFEWYNNNKNSTDEIDRAIVKWMDTVDKELGLHSWYNADEDAAFQETMLPLGIKKLPEILDRIKTDKVWEGFLMTTFAKISKVKDLDDVSLTDEGKAKWFNALKDIAVEAKTKSQNAVSSTNEPGIIQDQLMRDAEKLGVFALPYLVVEVKNGNKDAGNTIKMITGKDSEEFISNPEEAQVVEKLIEKIANEN